jgi:conjugal transfer pilus assembly protein TraW
VKRQINAAIAIGLVVLISQPIYGSSTQDRLGPVYPIIEPDWLEWLPKQAEKRLGEMTRSFSESQLKEAIQRQMPEIELPEVKTTRIYYVDPSVRTNQPVTDHQGKIVVPSGSRVNPLEHLPEFRPIAIIDGKKKKQVEWAKGRILSLKPMVLITRGDVLDLDHQLGVSVYPVPKALIERFTIERVPVLLSEEGKQIRIEEVAP